MHDFEAVDLLRQAIMLVLTLSLPALLAALAISIVISILQTVTQVQDQTLTLVPKIIIVLATTAIVSPWMLERLIEFSRNMFAVTN